MENEQKVNFCSSSLEAAKNNTRNYFDGKALKTGMVNWKSRAFVKKKNLLLSLSRSLRVAAVEIYALPAAADFSMRRCLKGGED